eukprot:gb/GFBE01066125.1/.p1 GENE.gb/GFBE01066125.1/~~gb/GFBE01066125.1/.p1  ORF type:complete len:126 (+),score=19.94 gb/GFBE01066125.1/:1-378(+)
MSMASNDRAAEARDASREEDDCPSFSEKTYSLGLFCLLTMVIAATAVGLLHGTGMVELSSSHRCPADPRVGKQYGGCQIKQDFRAVLSFLLGALVTTVTWCPEIPSRRNHLDGVLRKVESCAGLL